MGGCSLLHYLQVLILQTDLTGNIGLQSRDFRSPGPATGRLHQPGIRELLTDSIEKHLPAADSRSNGAANFIRTGVVGVADAEVVLKNTRFPIFACRGTASDMSKDLSGSENFWIGPRDLGAC